MNFTHRCAKSVPKRNGVFGGKRECGILTSEIMNSGFSITTQQHTLRHSIVTDDNKKQ
jgi:hypothetical protein